MNDSVADPRVAGEHCEFHSSVRNVQTGSKLRRNLFRPMLARVGLRVLEQPFHCYLIGAVPEFFLAAKSFCFQYPFRPDLEDGIRTVRHDISSVAAYRALSVLRCRKLHDLHEQRRFFAIL